jgi:pimeloyl-ACP methyl ester carboxylesterase
VEGSTSCRLMCRGRVRRVRTRSNRTAGSSLRRCNPARSIPIPLADPRRRTLATRTSSRRAAGWKWPATKSLKRSAGAGWVWSTKRGSAELKHSPDEMFKHIQAPALALAGEKDLNVPASHAARAAAIMKSAGNRAPRASLSPAWITASRPPQRIPPKPCASATTFRTFGGRMIRRCTRRSWGGWRGSRSGDALSGSLDSSGRL